MALRCCPPDQKRPFPNGLGLSCGPALHGMGAAFQMRFDKGYRIRTCQALHIKREQIPDDVRFISHIQFTPRAL